MINMRKKNFFSNKLKNINYLINNLLEKNLNKLKLVNLINFTLSQKIVLTFVALSILFVSYLLIPTFYKQSDVVKQLNNELVKS